MKICYLADGKSIHTQRWIKYFANRDHEVHLISKAPCSSLDGVHMHLLRRLPESGSTAAMNLVTTVAQTRKLLKEISPDILHSHYVLDYGSYGALSGFHPLIISAWGTDVLEVPKRSRFLRLLTKYDLKKADIITCDGENSKIAMIDMGIDSGKINLIFHGIDTRKFHPERRDESLKARLGLSRYPLVISTRSLEPIYDLGSLVEAIPMVLKEAPDARFIIAGDGSDKKSLIKMAESLNVYDHVIFTGAIPHSELPGYLASSDVYVSTSLSDGGIAVSTLEAMASGLTPITTDVGDVRILIKDGENGFVVPTRNPVQLAEKIIYLLQNKGILKRIGAMNRSLIEERCDYYKEMDKMERIYRGLIEEHSK